jgi:hypothetical protein
MENIPSLSVEATFLPPTEMVAPDRALPVALSTTFPVSFWALEIMAHAANTANNKIRFMILSFKINNKALQLYGCSFYK